MDIFSANNGGTSSPPWQLSPPHGSPLTLKSACRYPERTCFKCASLLTSTHTSASASTSTSTSASTSAPTSASTSAPTSPVAYKRALPSSTSPSARSPPAAPVGALPGSSSLPPPLLPVSPRSEPPFRPACHLSLSPVRLAPLSPSLRPCNVNSRCPCAIGNDGRSSGSDSEEGGEEGTCESYCSSCCFCCACASSCGANGGETGDFARTGDCGGCNGDENEPCSPLPVSYGGRGSLRADDDYKDDGGDGEKNSNNSNDDAVDVDGSHGSRIGGNVRGNVSNEGDEATNQPSTEQVAMGGSGSAVGTSAGRSSGGGGTSARSSESGDPSTSSSRARGCDDAPNATTVTTTAAAAAAAASASASPARLSGKEHGGVPVTNEYGGSQTTPGGTFSHLHPSSSSAASPSSPSSSASTPAPSFASTSPFAAFVPVTDVSSILSAPRALQLSKSAKNLVAAASGLAGAINTSVGAINTSAMSDFLATSASHMDRIMRRSSSASAVAPVVTRSTVSAHAQLAVSAEAVTGQVGAGQAVAGQAVAGQAVAGVASGAEGSRGLGADGADASAGAAGAAAHSACQGDQRCAIGGGADGGECTDMTRVGNGAGVAGGKRELEQKREALEGLQQEQQQECQRQERQHEHRVRWEEWQQMAVRLHEQIQQKMLTPTKEGEKDKPIVGATGGGPNIQSGSLEGLAVAASGCVADGVADTHTGPPVAAASTAPGECTLEEGHVSAVPNNSGLETLGCDESGAVLGDGRTGVAEAGGGDGGSSSRVGWEVAGWFRQVTGWEGAIGTVGLPSERAGLLRTNGLRLHWKPAVGNKIELAVEARVGSGAAKGWIAVGFKPGGDAATADAVIGQTSTAPVAAYTISPDGQVMLTNTFSIGDATLERSRLRAVIRFTRNNGDGAVHVKVRGQNTIIWAYDIDGEKAINYQNRRSGSVVVNFGCVGGAPAVENPLNPIPGSNSGMATTTVPGAPASPAVPAIGYCPKSSLAGYAYSANLDGGSFVLHWKPVQGQAIQMAMEATAGSSASNGWFGIGWSRDGSMSPSYSVIKSGSSLAAYYINGYKRKNVAPTNEISLGTPSLSRSAAGSLIAQ
ncbi:unnamed protein product [Closterium sp. Naga37s-1]|nr:unnamed protein product [Closterium sp. Naga37s-1]